MSEIQQAIESLSEKTYYRIGEVAKITRVKPYVLRFWESEFNVISPPKSRSKQRMYRKKDIETILTIKDLLYRQGFTIKGARARLADIAREERRAEAQQGLPAQTAQAAQPLPPTQGQILVEIRAELEELRALLDR
jgi:DNA-binding transcriptional MerR regulator